MKKRGETQEPLHPSRDAYNRPAEYELPYGGDKGIHISGQGYYEHDELATYTANPEHYEIPPDSSLLQPIQGRLFDPDKVEGANRSKLARKRFQTDDNMDPSAKDIREQAMLKSKIPTSDLQPRSEGVPESTLISHNRGKPWAGGNAAGWYSGPAGVRGEGEPDTIAVDPSLRSTTDTLVHEAGHRKHLGEMPAYSDLVTHPRGRWPDPLKEGAADAYEDRYGGPDAKQVSAMSNDIEEGKGKFDSYQFTGYSTGPMINESRGWTPEDRAVYAATRAHGSETGELAHYKPQGRHVMEGSAGRTIEEWDAGEPSVKGDPTLDATVHSLIQAGPHAKQALRQTGLKDVGAAMYRRHQDRQLLTQGQEIQGALFHEVRGLKSQKVQGYVSNPEAMASHVDDWDEHSVDIDAVHARQPEGTEFGWSHHMSHNQFGEAPRKAKDVKESLNVSTPHAKKRGFI